MKPATCSKILSYRRIDAPQRVLRVETRHRYHLKARNMLYSLYYSEYITAHNIALVNCRQLECLKN